MKDSAPDRDSTTHLGAGVSPRAGVVSHLPAGRMKAVGTSAVEIGTLVYRDGEPVDEIPRLGLTAQLADKLREAAESVAAYGPLGAGWEDHPAGRIAVIVAEAQD